MLYGSYNSVLEQAQRKTTLQVYYKLEGMGKEEPCTVSPLELELICLNVQNLKDYVF